MIDEVKEFIQLNKDAINDNSWDVVYDNANFTLDSSAIGELTFSLLKVGINPIVEQGLDYIPDYYLSDTRITEFTIPESIKLIGEGAFSYSRIKKIVIPEGVETLGSYAFYDCAELEEIWILGDLHELGSECFYGCSGILYCKKDSAVDIYLAGNDVCQFDVRYI